MATMQNPHALESTTSEERRITCAVVWNQLWWTAGYSLTSGGFLTYFAADLGANAFWISLLLVVPETAGILAIFARRLIRISASRRRIWLVTSLAARGVSLGIPLAVWLPSAGFAHDAAVALLVVSLALASALQAIAYVTFLSWMSDLVPSVHWGRFFARQKIADACVLLVVPVAAGYLSQSWRSALPSGTIDVAFAATFLFGTALLLVSLLPIARLRDTPQELPMAKTLPDCAVIAATWRNRSLRWLLVHSWWLALASGLTQAAFFTYSKNVLGISLGTYYVLTNVMHLVSIPASWAAGSTCDRFGSKRPLLWGLLIAGSSLFFWLAATRAHLWWLFGAYACWGAFAVVNLAGRNLLLELSPRSDNTAQMTLFRQVAGLLAGISGFLGGLWLDALLASQFSVEFGGARWGGHHVLFAISLIGRLTSVLWVIPISEPARRPTSDGTRSP